MKLSSTAEESHWNLLQNNDVTLIWTGEYVALGMQDLNGKIEKTESVMGITCSPDESPCLLLVGASEDMGNDERSRGVTGMCLEVPDVDMRPFFKERAENNLLASLTNWCVHEYSFSVDAALPDDTIEHFVGLDASLADPVRFTQLVYVASVMPALMCIAPGIGSLNYHQ